MIKEFLLIFIINYIGVILTEILHLPIPGTITGMLLLFALLYFKILKLSHIENAGNFLLLNMTIFFSTSFSESDRELIFIENRNI